MNGDLAINALYSAIRTLPKNLQLNLIKKIIIDNDFYEDFVDLKIANQRIREPDIEYEAYRSKRIKKS